MKKMVLSLLLLLSSATMATDTCHIVKDNKLNIKVNDAQLGSVTEVQFNSIIDRAEEVYGPIFKEMGKTLEVIRKWEDGTVNAYAQQSGDVWKVSMFGGLARHATITPDAFALVVCHEIGHHIGGYPKKWGRWASNEGQADYFGNAKCLRKYMEVDLNTGVMERVDVPSIVEEKCNANFTDAEEIAMCKRGALAGLSLGNLFRALRKLPKPLMFSTPDETVVTRIDHSHPAPQCRLDTYFAGAICDKDAYDDVSNTDLAKGLCARQDDYIDGVRPLCWFKP